MPAAVGRIPLALDQTALLEVVEQSDEVARVVAERVGDRRLRLARSLVEHGEHGQVKRARPGRLVVLVYAVLHREAEPLEQEGRAGDELTRRPHSGFHADGLIGRSHDGQYSRHQSGCVLSLSSPMIGGLDQ